jgi:hypothetical protein
MTTTSSTAKPCLERDDENDIRSVKLTRLNYGQPVDGITQVAFTVVDMETAIDRYVNEFGVGPWYLRGPFTPAKATYRDQPTAPSVSLAMAFSGHMMIELIQQHDDSPSVYSETIARSGHGFHHFGVATFDFDNRADFYRQSGYVCVFTDITPVGTRVAYFDCQGALPGMIELIEMNSAQERRYSRIYAEAAAWDGNDPIRRG